MTSISRLDLLSWIRDFKVVIRPDCPLPITEQQPHYSQEHLLCPLVLQREPHIVGTVINECRVVRADLI